MLERILQILNALVSRGFGTVAASWLLLVATLWLVLRVPVARALLRRVARPSVARLWGLAAWTAIVGTGIHYASTETLFDHCEPQIVSVAAMASRGGAIYHELDAGVRYNLLYGPGTYLIPAFFVRLLGAEVWAVKLPVVLALAAGSTLLWRGFTGLAGAGLGAALFAFTATSLLAFGQTLFWVRPEAYLLFAAALGLHGATRLEGHAAWIAVGAAAGLASAVKVPGAGYLLPAIALLGLRRGPRPALLAAASGAGVAALPLLLPQVPAATYLRWLSTASGHGFLSELLVRHALLALGIAAPVVVLWLAPRSWREPRRRSLPYLGAVAAMLALCVLTASKRGAGYWYFLPALPAVIASIPIVLRSPAAVTPGSVPAAAWLVHTLLVVLAAVFAWRFVYLEPLRQNARFAPIRTELEGLVEQARKEGTVGFVPTGSGVVQHYRAVPVLRGGRLWFDPASMMDLHLSGIPVSEETLRIFEECRVHTWISRIGAPPFTVHSFYPPGDELFGDEIRSLFLARYERVGRSTFFEFWRCRDGEE